MSAQVYDGRRAAMGVEPESASAESLRPLYLGSVTYFGSYMVDIVAHRELELTAPGFILLWERVRT